MGMFKVFFMKKVKRKNKKDVNTIKPKPYTVKQENDIVIGKMLMWIFILSLPFSGFLLLVASGNIKVLLLIWGILCLLFATYNLLGVIFKWDHSRVCSKSFLKKTYSFDIRNDWNKEDTKDNVSLVVICVIFGVIFLISAIFH